MKRLLRRPTQDESTRFFTLAVIGWGGLIGSGVSILYAGSILAALPRYVYRELAFPADRNVVAIGAVFAAFFAVEALSGAINYDGASTLRQLASDLPFLGFLVVYPRLALSSRLDIVRSVEFGAVSGAFGVFALALLQTVVLDFERAEGGAGNPGVLALICALLYGLCILTAMRRTGRMQSIALLAAVCAAASLLLTGMRALWPMLLIAPFIPLVVLRPTISVGVLGRGALVAALPVAVALFLTYGMVGDRVVDLAADIDRIKGGDFGNSVGERLKIWDTGLELAAAKPVFGHGPAVMSEDNARGTGFSHLHNFLLNAMVRTGVIGVVAILALFVAPLWILVRQRSDDISRFGVAMLMTLQAAFLLSGTVGIMLGHDILDALFIYGTTVASFLVLGEGARTGKSQSAREIRRQSSPSLKRASARRTPIFSSFSSYDRAAEYG